MVFHKVQGWEKTQGRSQQPHLGSSFKNRGLYELLLNPTIFLIEFVCDGLQNKPGKVAVNKETA